MRYNRIIFNPLVIKNKSKNKRVIYQTHRHSYVHYSMPWLRLFYLHTGK